MFRDEKIDVTETSEYTKHIPFNYMRSIIAGQMTAYVVFDDVGDKSDEYGLYVTTVHDGWLELVWVYINDPDTELSEKALFFAHIISTDRKRRDQELKGAFIELHEDEAWDDAVNILKLCGMEARIGDGNVYEFTLSQVKGAGTLKKAADRVKCLDLTQADDDMKKGLCALMKKDDRPIPISEEIDWKMYIPTLSFISLKGDIPSGAILISKDDDYLIIELSYSADTVALPALLFNALAAAVKEYGADQKVLVPVVVNKTGLLVKKMVPDAYRTRIINGLVRF